MKKTVIMILCMLMLVTCKKDAEPVMVSVKYNDINTSATKVVISGSYEYNMPIESFEILYSENENMDLSKSVKVYPGGNEFTATLENLNAGTDYYFQAYFYGEYNSAKTEVKSFKTEELLLEVTTNDVTNITSNSAVCGGNVTDDGGATITARGVCWSTSPNPTIDNSHTIDGSGTGSFTSNLSNLAPQTTYYVRAYATNEKGTSYGEQKEFTTLVNEVLPVVTTNNVTNVTQTTAISGGNVTSDGNAAVTARGVCWSTTPNPTIDNSHTTDGSGTGSFTSNLSNLAPQTTYYVRAYATNEKGTSYGEQKSFTTLATTGSINGYDWVDLGLTSGLKWATCNVGASSPEDYGDYFAWGETTTKAEYTQENSITYGLTITDLRSQGYIDGDGNLTSSHDAATVNWGGSWRMPTKTEMKELIVECTWTWTTQNGVEGSKVTGPNGNHIFLPAAGYRIGSSLSDAGSDGYYWSSTPNDDYYDRSAYGLYFGNGYENVGWSYGRSIGQTVRPITE